MAKVAYLRNRKLLRCLIFLMKPVALLSPVPRTKPFVSAVFRTKVTLFCSINLFIKRNALLSALIRTKPYILAYIP
jgi:hypothetical protein